MLELHRKLARFSLAGLAAAASLSLGTALTAPAQSANPPSFDLIATLNVPVAEIAAAGNSGKLVVFTASTTQTIGFVDISNPAAPALTGTMPVPGEPTSVAITPNGSYALVTVDGTPDVLLVVDIKARTPAIVRSLPLGGQPDHVAVSPNGRYAAIAIENERAEIPGPDMPQAPAGFLTILDIQGPPAAWSTRDVSLTGIADRFPTDPEPEYISINQQNIAAITLQENNFVVLVNLVTGTVAGGFSAGITTHAADLTNGGGISFTQTLTARREPDGIAWTPGGRLVTANEGDYSDDLAPAGFVGGRDFTVFSSAGAVLFEPGATLEQAAAGAGLYPDNRSASRGIETEAVAVEKYQGQTLLFVGAERGNFVAVYLFENETSPQLLQILPAGVRPEGLLPIPNRKLLVVANEGSNGSNGSISIFAAK